MALVWETVYSTPVSGVLRAKVPGGWLVRVDLSVTFYPDPEHKWDGSSLP